MSAAVLAEVERIAAGDDPSDEILRRVVDLLHSSFESYSWVGIYFVEGDELVFHVEGNRAIVARTPDFLSLAGSVPVPAAKRNATWDEVIRRTRAARSGRAR